jgi:hypothetical protein
MMVLIEGLPPTVLGIRASGVVTVGDHRAVLMPLVRRAGDGIRLLLDVDDTVDVEWPGREHELSVLGTCSLGSCAIMAGPGTSLQAYRLVSCLDTERLRQFPPDERERAVAWLLSVDGRTAPRPARPSLRPLSADVTASPGRPIGTRAEGPPPVRAVSARATPPGRPVSLTGVRSRPQRRGTR